MQKLPKEIEAKRKMVDNLQKVIDQPALGQDDIAALKEKMKTVRGEIEELTNKKNVSNDPIEDKLTLFRQRVSTFLRMSQQVLETQILEIRDFFCQKIRQIEGRSALLC